LDCISPFLALFYNYEIAVGYHTDVEIVSQNMGREIRRLDLGELHFVFVLINQKSKLLRGVNTFFVGFADLINLAVH
jgi:hypothetical protein